MIVKPYASLLLYIGAVLCLFLPFATVSCGGMHVMTFTGQELATGTHITTVQMFGPPKSQHIPPNPFAAGAGMIGLLGVVLSVIGRRMGARFNLMAAWLGVFGFIDMLSLRSNLTDQIQKQSQGLASVEWLSGYTFAFLFFLAAAVWNVYESLLDRKKRTLEANSKPTNPDTPGDDTAAFPTESVN